MNAMNPLRLLVATFALIIFSAGAAVADSGKKGSSIGTFAGIEQGDYAHFLIKDPKGRNESFFVLRPSNSVKSYLDNPDKLKGRKIRVFWEERNEHIPEAGGKQKIKIVTKVEERR